MSEETNTTTPTSTPTPTTEESKEQLQKIDKGYYQLEQVKFRKDTALDGLEYYVLQFKNTTEDDASLVLQNLTKKKEEGGMGWSGVALVGVINSAVRAAQRTKAQNEINALDGEDAKINEIRKRLANNPVLLSPESAEAWVPGERELTLNGMMRKVASLMAEGNAVEAMKLLQEVNKQVASQLNENQ